VAVLPTLVTGDFVKSLIAVGPPVTREIKVQVLVEVEV
jgi:hypothetical protein